MPVLWKVSESYYTSTSFPQLGSSLTGSRPLLQTQRLTHTHSPSPFQVLAAVPGERQGVGTARRGSQRDGGGA